MCSKYALAALFLCAAAPVFSQSAPAGIESVWRVDAGAGVSGYHVDFFGPGDMEGAKLWIDLYPNRGPKFLHPLGLEIEGQDLSFGGPQPNPPGVTLNQVSREDSYGGGPIYEYRHFKNFTPYGKFLWEQGSIDFNVQLPYYKHDNRTLYTPGVGFQYRLMHHVSFRAEYEMQFWQRLFQNHAVAATTGVELKPRGITLGAAYEFDRIHIGGSPKEK
jgi:hypothetical protein